MMSGKCNIEKYVCEVVRIRAKKSPFETFGVKVLNAHITYLEETKPNYFC